MEFMTGFAGFVLLIAVIIWRSIARERLRTRKLTRLAPELGLSMLNGNTNLGINTALVSKGDVGRNRFRNTMQGTGSALAVMLFDFYYQVDSGDDQTSSWHTVAAFEFVDREFPNFSITRSGILSRRASGKISIEAHPEFSRRFVVNGRDQAGIQHLLQPGFLQFVVSFPGSDKLVIETAGPWLVLYRRGRRIRPEHWKSFLDETVTQ